MARKKSEKTFTKEVEAELESVFVGAFKTAVPSLVKKYEIKVSSKEVEALFQSGSKKINLVGMTLDQLGKYILKYPTATIEANYSYPHLHLKTMDDIFIKIDNFEYSEENREELKSTIIKWLYQKYSEEDSES